MKVVAFNGSPRPKGNTYCLINHAFEKLEGYGIQTEIVQLGGKKLSGCKACYTCFKTQNVQCSTSDDAINDCIRKMIEADAILIASPTYFTDVTTEIKALIDRAGMVMRANGHLLKHKIGAAIVAVRRAGAIQAFDTINHFFLISQMIVCGSSYWNIGIGREIGDVDKDPEGIQTMHDLADNIAWTLEKIKRD